MSAASSVGLIVNPIAGMGGRVGLKGTDGPDVLRRAVELGAVAVAAERTDRALARMHDGCAGMRLVAGRGRMGADLAEAHGFDTEVLPGRGSESTTAEDTRLAAAELMRRRVDVIVFAGGDGTARDIYAVVGDRVPMLGVPTGVKMQSGVFATTPESAGDVVVAFVGSPHARVREADVVDADLHDDTISTRLYGAARVPDDRLRVQPVKSRGRPHDEDALDAVCAAIAASMDPRRIYLLGPGTTMRRVARVLGLEKTLLGVDAVRAGRLLGSDLAERDLLALIAEEPVTLLIGVIGGQGSILGRGNQQLSPAVLRRVGVENVEIVAGLGKLLALEPPLLRTLVCRVAA